MRIWIVGDENEWLSGRLARYLPVEVIAGTPDEPGGHVIVLGEPVPDDAIDSATTLVLVEPELAERDRVTRSLAAREVPRLEVVENVAAGIRAERTWALLLSLATGIHQAAEALVTKPVSRADLVTADPSAGSWLEVPPAVSLHGRTLGLIGFSPTGWRLAALAAQMGMRVVFWPEPATHSVEVEIEGAALRSDANRRGFDEVLRTADIVVLDVGYGDDTVCLIDSPELALMRSDAMLINTAHGRAIDEGALIQALRDGRLGGVALDRFNYEPLPDDSPLRTFQRVLLTPGIAVPATDAVRDRTVVEVAQLLESLDGRLPRSRRIRHVTRRRMAR